MIAFINTFLSYLILVIANAIIIVIAVVCGKKLREIKDAKEAAKLPDTDQEQKEI